MNERPAPRVERSQLAFFHPAEERHVSSRQPFDARALRPLPDDDEPLRPPLKRAQRQVHALVRDERRDDQKRRLNARRSAFRADAGGRALEALRLDRRLDDERVAVVVALDAIAGVRAVRDERVRPGRRRRLPSPEVVRRSAEKGPPQGPAGDARLVRRLGLTHVPQGGVHVGDVEGRRGRDRADGHAVAAGDDQAVTIQLE